jgi:hypothetical protein
MSTCSGVRDPTAPSRPSSLTCLENNINGENLMEMDQTHLKDMGIKKVGDRVRIGSQAKQLRNKEYKKASRRVSNRVCCPFFYTTHGL